MFATLENVMLMDKEIRLDKENKNVYCLTCYQRGNKNLILIKNVDIDVYNSLEVDSLISVKVKLISWAQGNNHGVSVQYVDMVRK
ncbi:MAG: hypothetical protein ACRC1F_03200 [Metamycoplasmataceae bacterium]